MAATVRTYDIETASFSSYTEDHPRKLHHSPLPRKQQSFYGDDGDDEVYSSYDDDDDDDGDEELSLGKPKPSPHAGDPPQKPQIFQDDEEDLSSYYDDEDDVDDDFSPRKPGSKPSHHNLYDDEEDDYDNDDEYDYYCDNDDDDDERDNQEEVVDSASNTGERNWQHLKNPYEEEKVEVERHASHWRSQHDRRHHPLTQESFSRSSSNRRLTQEDTAALEREKGYVSVDSNELSVPILTVYTGDDSQQQQQQYSGLSGDGRVYPVDAIETPGAKNNNKKNENKGGKKPILVWIASLLFLGGMGYLMYWLYTQAVFSIHEATDDDYYSLRDPPINTTNNNNSSSSSSSAGVDNDLVPPIPVAPSDIASKCSRSTISSNTFALLECEGICRKAACCYVGTNATSTATTDTFNVETCLEKNNATDQRCEGYSPHCDFIYGTLPAATITTNGTSAAARINETLPSPPPDTLVETCRLDRVGTSLNSALQCIDACYYGYCCFSSYADILLNDSNKDNIAARTTTQPSCYRNDPNTCQQYAPCLAVLVGQIKTLLQQQDNNTTNTTSSDDLKVDTAPASLADTCSSDSFTGQVGYVSCMSDCWPALCCVNTDQSCLADNMAACQSYTPCQTLLGRVLGDTTIVPPNNDDNNNSTNNSTQSTIPTPPDNIIEICSLASLVMNTTLLECIEVCAPGECCSGSCLDANLETCILYTPCQNLLATPTNTTAGSNTTNSSSSSGDVPVVLPIPEGLEDACSVASMTDPDGFRLCASKCSVALCCNSERNSCLESNLATCLLYSLCDILNSPLIGNGNNNATVALPPAPENITAICNPANLVNTKSSFRCQEVCNISACCTLSGTHSCYGQFPIECDTYKPCEVLQTQAPSTSPAPSFSILPSILPSTSSVPSSIFPSILPSLSEQPTKLPSNFPSVVPFVLDPPPINLPAICRDDLVQCESICEAAACCDDPTVNGCFQSFPITCSQYSPCVVLQNMVRADRYCANDYISSNGVGDCRDECTRGNCCFRGPNDLASCANNVDYCADYQPCSVLLAFREATDVADACLPDVVQNSEMALANCEEICSVGSCCFDKQSTCSIPVDCADYQACEFLYPSTSPATIEIGPTSAPSATANVDVIIGECSPESLLSPGGRESCIAVCQTGACCFRPESDPKSCSNDQGYCSAFAPCLSLRSAGRNGAPLPTAMPPEFDCDTEDGDLTSCFEACEMNSCCYNGTPCRDDVKPMCPSIVQVCSEIMELQA